MTLKQASLSEKYQEILTSNKIGPLQRKYEEILLEKVAQEELEKQALLTRALEVGAQLAGRVARGGPSFLRSGAANLAESAAGMAEKRLASKITDNAANIKKFQTLNAPSTYTEPIIAKANQRAVDLASRRESMKGFLSPRSNADAVNEILSSARSRGALNNSPVPARPSTAAAPPPAAAAPPPTTAAAPPPTTAAAPPPTTAPPGKADELLNSLMKAAPIGVAGGLTGYGALRGWGEGQAQVVRSQQQGFNPATRF